MQEENFQLFCPVCGEELADDERVYQDDSDTIVGCEKCLTPCWAEILLQSA